MENFSQDQKALAHIIKMEIYFAENCVASAGSETRLAAAVGNREGLKRLAQLFVEKTEINEDAFLKECGIGKEYDPNPYC